MKPLFALVLAWPLTCAQAAPVRLSAAPHSAAAAVPAPTALRERALQVCLYLTDALRLNARQANAVRRAALRELQQMANPKAKKATQAAAKRSFDATMQRVLTREQLTSFEQLRGRKPVAELLVPPAAASAR